MFRKREPLDLRGAHRLRVLARALGPAYVRIGGAWANSAYFQDDDQPAMAKPPAGYQGVLARAINLSRIDKASLTLPTAAQRYTLSADELQGKTVKLDGRVLAVLPGDRLPALTPVAAAKGELALAAASITFLAIPAAANPACS